MHKIRPVFRNPQTWILLIALALRLAPVLLMSNVGIGLDDMFQYDMLGRSLASGDGFRWYSQPDLDLILRYITIDISHIAYDPRGVETTFRAPMYPIFLAVIYWFVGPASPMRFLAVRIVQAGIGALLALLTFHLARRLDPEREATALVSGWIVALYPLFLLFPMALATEELFFVLVWWAMLLLLRAAESKRLGAFLAAGAVFGLAILTRSIIALVLPFAAWWVWREAKSFRKAAVFLATAGLIVFPWALRNTLLSGKPSFVESSMGYNLYLGYHPQGTGTFQVGISFDLLTIIDDAERDRIGTDKALAFIREDPGRVPYLILRKAGYFFGLERRALTYFYTNNFFGYLPLPALLAAACIFLLPFIIITLSAAFGAAVLPHSSPKTLMLLLAGFYILPHLLIMAEERFHFLLVPLIAVWAAAAWARRGEIFAAFRSREGWAKLWLPVAVNAMLIGYWVFELASDAQKLAVVFGPDGNTASFPY